MEGMRSKGDLQNITAPVQWFASNSVTWISFPGESSNLVGVSRGIGLLKQVSSCVKIGQKAYQEILQMFVLAVVGFKYIVLKVYSMKLAFESDQKLLRGS